MLALADTPKRDADGRILVVIQLDGGNDGLNTVVPYADDLYAKARPTLRIEPKTVLKLNDRVALHPSLKDLHKLWEAGDLAVVQGVGYPNPNRSHFRAMEIWHAGDAGPVPDAGWLGRLADIQPSLGPCYIGREAIPLSVRARRFFTPSIASLSDYRIPPGALKTSGRTTPPADELAREVQRGSRPPSHAPPSSKPSPATYPRLSPARSKSDWQRFAS